MGRKKIPIERIPDNRNRQVCVCLLICLLVCLCSFLLHTSFETQFIFFKCMLILNLYIPIFKFGIQERFYNSH